jgi:hypothetical protein
VGNTCIRNDTGNKDNVSVTLSDYSKTNAGTYTAKVTALSNPNYTLSSSVTKSWTINKAQLTSSWLNCGTFAYNGETRYAILRVSGFVNGEASSTTTSSFSGSSYTLEKSTGSVDLKFSYKNANTYSFNVTGFNNSNYEFASTSNQVTVTKPQLSVQWVGSNYTYDGNSHEIKAYISGFVNGEESSISLSNFTRSFSNGSTSLDPTVSTGSGSLILTFSIKDAATYSFSISGYSGNYTIPDKTTNAKTVKVSCKAVTASWSGSDLYTYTGLSQGKTLYISGIASGDISTFKNYLTTSGVNPTITSDASGVSYYFGAINKGTYNISVSAKSTLKNYSFTAQSKEFEIKPKALETSWSSSTNNWSDTYDGNNKTITLTISGFVNGEESSISLSNFTSSRTISGYDNSVSGMLKLSYSFKDSGSYSINVSAFSNSNYSFTATDKNYTINKKAVTVYWEGLDSYTYNGTTQGKTLYISGILSNEVATVNNCLTYTNSNITPTITTDSSGIKLSFKAINAGSYSVVVKGNTSLKNYELSTQKATFNISKKILTVDTSSISSENLQFNGLVSGESISKSNYTLSIYEDSQHKKLLSISDLQVNTTYYYHIDLIGNSNYSLSNSDGSFEKEEA